MRSKVYVQFPPVNLLEHTLCSWCLNALEYKFILKHQCLIFFADSQNVHIALKNTQAPLELIRAHISHLYPHLNIQFFCATNEAFDIQARHIRIFQHFCTLKNALLAQHKNPQNTNENQDISVVQLLDFILQTCIEEGASDIHFECQNVVQDSPIYKYTQDKHKARVRIRVDGMLRERFSLESDVFEALSSRLKLECELDITQIRQSQDGRFSREFGAQSYDFRLSVLPAFGGESIVIRILNKNTQTITLQSLGFNCAHLDIIKRNIIAPYGIILLTGPTGSGKSTTLYAILESIKSPTKKIITLEDPIEYQMELVTQVIVNEKHNFGFAKALRALLRHDPDVLMVGEIRDEQSLEIALRASLTGHLVLSTLHANDSLGVVERLLDMGAQNYLLASSLRLIISQRLVRKLCPHCKTPLSLQDMKQTLIKYNLQHFNDKIKNGVFFAPRGCGYCNMQGFSGRVLIAECLENADILCSYIKSPHNKAQMLQSLQEKGFESMFENGLKIVSEGLSSFEEVYRVCKI
ncbi:GspE/PulE family protein [Helicobacter sp. MIT 21-1697]|uniref:GspE/PulE family protein n=1 Tax=Helicobacter sp. MIT 21-1697 TaxID=2993733 RepID=UPI00224ABA9D|nr:GspE/PulE family protein [Helicobacter sp. MIT 21-1697]MCX2717689.1 GspE/PulE family protein [Helicobacter sp. MIT 21-1697]